MTYRNLRSYAHGIALGYIRILKSSAFLLTGVLAIAVVSILIVTPLWFLATQHTTAYTISFVGAIAAAGLGLVAYRLATDRSYRARSLRRITRAIGFLLALFLLYLTVYLYSREVLAAAVPLSVVLAAAIGLLLHGKSKKQT